MSGEDAAVTIKTRTLVGGPMTEQWSMSGDQGLLWNRGSLPLNSGDTFQVRIKTWSRRFSGNQRKGPILPSLFSMTKKNQ